MPVLVLHAERDIQVVRADFDALRAAKPDARFVLLPASQSHAENFAGGPAGQSRAV